MKLSAARTKLAKGMFAGLSPPKPVQVLKSKDHKLRVRSGGWQKAAAKRLRKAFIDEEIALYVCAHSLGSSQPCLTKLPPEIISRLIQIRGGLPDYPYRVTARLLRSTGAQQALLAELNAGVLVVDREEFARWYKREKRKGKWRSQRGPRTETRGRRSKRTDALTKAILGAVDAGSWNAEDGVMELWRLLKRQGFQHLSHDTVARIIDDLHHQTKKPALRRKRRRARRFGDS